LKLKISDSFTNEKNVVYIPSCNADISINESIHNVDNSGNIITIAENNTSNKITLRKNSKLGQVHSTTDFIFRDSNDFDEEPNEVLQVNTLTADEITTLRREELNADDFNLEHLNETEKNEILKLLMQNFKVFSKSYQTLGCTDAITPEFKLLHNFPIQTKPYPIPKIAHDFAKQEIQKLLEAGIIEPSTSNYSFPIIFVKKKSDSKKLKFRMVVDYRLLNSVTESFKICLPKIADILHEISGKKWYSVLDLKSAFFQIKLKNSDKQKLAFCSELGNFQPTRLPFGSKNSTSYFHLLISKCLDDLKGPNIQFFLDDIIIAANSISEMNTRLQLVFDRLAKFNLTLDPNKIQICKTNITYLGFNISANGYAPSEDNIQKVTKFPVPQNVKQVQSYLGMMNYFRHLIFNYAEVVEPIVNLTRKGTPFVWSENCQDAFNVMQEIILNKPTIKNYDESKPLYLTTDASKVALCAILLQKDGENFYPIEFFSKQLSPSERNYPSIRRELFAIFMGIKHFREYLYGRHFYLLTDAKSLTYHMNLDKQPDIVKRWLLYLQDFSYNIDHIKGCDNPADFLSRMQIEDVEVNNLFHMGDQLSHSNIKLCQSMDSCTSEIIKKIEEKDSKTCQKYFIDSYTGLLMFKIKSGKDQILNKIYIPRNLVRDCLLVAHAPHFGVQKTYDFIKIKYFWPGMYADVKNFCENCCNCMQNKPKRKTITHSIPKHHLAPGEFLAIDIVGKLPRSVDNQNYILTIVDHYSRYLEAIPIPNTTSNTIIRHLNYYFSRFGLPKYILSDNATYFKSDEIVNFYESLRIEHRKSSIYYPKSNGLLERTHRVLKESVASISQKVHDWSTSLLFFKLHYNNSKHVVTQYTPAELFFGRRVNIPIHSYDDPKYVEDFSIYLNKVQKQLKEFNENVKVNEENYFKKHDKYIKGFKREKLQLGDKVFMQVFVDPQVLHPKYKGPYEISKIFRNENYLVKVTEGDEIKFVKVHVSKIFKQPELRENCKSV
ncbi:Transposon Tf2-9 polyprotein, partial [Araneus ventricosus]